MTQTKISNNMLAAGVATKSPSTSSGLPADDGKFVRLNSSGLLPDAYLPNGLPLVAISADPDNPAAGEAVMWQSDGTGTGDTGDIMMKITRSPTKATYAVSADFSGFTINDSYTINVPVNANGTGVDFLIITEGVDATGSASASANRIAVGCSTGPSAGTLAETVVDAINGHYGSGGLYNHGFASANAGVFTAAGVTATLNGSTQVTLTSTFAGTNANAIAVANVNGNAAHNGTLSGGLDASTKMVTLVDHSS